MELLEESDDDTSFVFCGPPSDSEDGGPPIPFVPPSIPLVPPPPPPLPSPTPPHKRNQNRDPLSLSSLGILPEGKNLPRQKFVAVFPIGIADDPEFVVVKRLLGKGGSNMAGIAKECNAKLRLRGAGSGFVEGNGLEADMPLQLHVSCEDYADYTEAITRVAHLIDNIYMHHQRFSRSKSREPLPLVVHLQELRRDDLGLKCRQHRIKHEEKLVLKKEADQTHHRSDGHKPPVKHNNSCGDKCPGVVANKPPCIEEVRSTKSSVRRPPQWNDTSLSLPIGAIKPVWTGKNRWNTYRP